MNEILTPESRVNYATTFLYIPQVPRMRLEDVLEHLFKQPSYHPTGASVGTYQFVPEISCEKGKFVCGAFVGTGDRVGDDFVSERLEALGLNTPDSNIFFNGCGHSFPVSGIIKISEQLADKNYGGFDLLAVGHLNIESQRLYATPEIIRKMQDRGVSPLLHLVEMD